MPEGAAVHELRVSRARRNSSDRPDSAFPKPTFQGEPFRKPSVDLRKWGTRGNTVPAPYNGSLALLLTQGSSAPKGPAGR